MLNEILRNTESATDVVHLNSRRWRFIKSAAWTLYIASVLLTGAPNKPLKEFSTPTQATVVQPILVNNVCPDNFIYADLTSFDPPGHNIWKRAGVWDARINDCVYDFSDMTIILPKVIPTPITRLRV